MRVALYQPWLYLHGGLERSILELVTRSKHEWVIFTGYYDPQGTFPEFKDLNIVELRRLSVKRDIPTVLKVALLIMTQKLPLEGFDALVIWSDGMGDLVTLRNNSLPTFVICSTPLRAVFDPVYQRTAMQKRGFVGRIAYRIFKYAFQGVDRKAWRHFDGVVATSLEVKKRIIRGKLCKDSSKMVLYHPGIDWYAFKVSDTFEPMLLVPGRIMWTKNIELAIDAFKKARLPSKWRLVISGFLDSKSLEYYESLKTRAKGNSRIEFIPSPSDQVLKGLYQTASAILFPPLNEDWGLVPLEAMATGKPVIANARGGPLESVLPGETGWLVEPSVEDWARVLEEIPRNKDLLVEMGRKGRKHVKKYDWSHFVSGIDHALEKWCNNAFEC